MRKEYDCVASMVVYNSLPEMVRHSAESFLNTDLKVKLYVVDNSPSPVLQESIQDLPSFYHHTGQNLGYGRANNWGINQSDSSKYYLILNPDVFIPKGTLELLHKYMDDNPDIGLCCPRVLNEDGTTQYLNKRFPTVLDFLLRRFLPNKFQSIFKKRMDRFEMRDIGYDNICNVPIISGAFMFCRTRVLKDIGGFDPRYFMYFEDFDLSRKFHLSGFKTVYYPYANIIHKWERASHKSLKMAFTFVVSGFKYFNKWGWKFF